MTYTPNFLPGKSGGVLLGATAQAWRKWTAKMFAKLGETPNFLASGYMTRVAGMVDSTVTLSGAYDQGNMPWTVNASGTVTLQFTNSVTLVIAGLVESITSSVDVTEPQMQEVVIANNGSFTAAIT